MARPRSCRLCQCTEPDPRRLVETLAWIPRLGHKLVQARVHVECFLAGGGAIADLADSQLWHLSGAAWDHLHFDLAGALARQRAADAAEAAETARLLAELAAAAAALAVPDYRRGTVRRPPSSPLRALHNPSLRAARGGVGEADGGVGSPGLVAHDPSVADYRDTSPHAKRAGRGDEGADTRQLRRAA